MRNQIVKYYKNQPTVNETSDIIMSKCWILPTYKSKTPEQKMLDKVSNIFMHKYFSGYLANCDIRNVEHHKDIDIDGVSVQGGFTINNEWVDWHSVSYQEWGSLFSKNSQNKLVLNKTYKLILMICNAALRSWIRGFSSENFKIIIFNRNNQYYRIFNISGVTEAFLQEAQFRLHNSSSKEVGAKVCSFCAFKNSCKPENVIDPTTEILSINSLDDVVIEEDLTIGNAIKDYLRTLNYKTSKHHDDGWLHPSAIAITKCNRRLYYDLVRAPQIKKIIPYLRHIFDVGHAVHDTLQEAMTACGVPIEVFAEDVTNRIHGRTDGATSDSIVEIKSAAHSSFKKFEKNGPSESHIQQTSIYSTILKKDWVLFQYFNKNDGTILEVKERHNQMEFDFISGRAQVILAHFNDQNPPPKIEEGVKIKARACKECPYLEHCRQ